ncbi:MAG TPA: MFS transporter [Chitinispirillaceae bacterium]|nr:MFS transporter [Chitinispirillaceae bacterium]
MKLTQQNKAVFGWVLYDWANSAFILTVVAGFFPVFFKSYWCAGIEPTVSTARLGTANAIAGIIVAVISPFIGALADARRTKKRFLAPFVLLGVICTIFLFFQPQGAWLPALLYFTIASVGFNSANLLYDSLLIDVADKDRMDWVSSMGYSVGYLGCGILFVFNVWMVMHPVNFGLDKTGAVKMSFLVAALWWIVFSVPLFSFVKERFVAIKKGIGETIQGALAGLKETSAKVVKTPGIVLFLLAYWLYIDGVNTFVLMSVDFGMSINISADGLMIALIIVQFVAFPAALLFGYLARKVGAFVMIIVGILIYILVSGVGSLVLQNQTQFIILAAITGLAQGGIQALSRSYFGKIVPPEHAAEYFGFYNVVGRFAVIIGPPTVGFVAYFTRKAGVPSVIASRIGMSSIALLFLAGLILLVFSNRFYSQGAVTGDR